MSEIKDTTMIETAVEEKPQSELTVEQQMAVDAKGYVLVSASAGSGKTHTMLKRIMQLIEGGAKLSKMLIIVYNEANASELREKIRTKLFEKACNSIGDKAETYREQIDDIAFSTICTIHAFCRSALKKHFEVLGLNPDFDILDTTEDNIYRSKALDKAIEECSEVDNTFLEMLTMFESRRSEENIRDNIVKFFEKMDVQWDCDQFIKTIKDNFQSQDIYEDIVWNKIKSKMEQVVSVVNEILPIFVAEKQDAAVRKLQEDILEMYPHFLVRNANAVKNIGDKRQEIGGKRMSSQQDFSANHPIEMQKASKCYSQTKALMEEVVVLFGDEEFRKKAFEQTKKYAMKLVDVTLRFKDIYEEMKAKDNVMTFGDLEHGAVRLIQAVDEGGNPLIDIGEGFEHVLVDEYQDVNGTQEYIISYLTKGRQAFMVGDVKQSIYGFRLSDPEIFLARQNYYSKNAEKDNINAPIFFKDNFRSDNAILKFVNDIFGDAMTVATAGVDYENEGKFNEVSEIQRNEGEVEVHIFETQRPGKEVAPLGIYKPINSVKPTMYKTALEKEAEFIANEIIELRGKTKHSFSLKKNKNDEWLPPRPLEWSDFAILFRGRNANTDKIIKVLKSKGIPVDEGSFAKEKEPAETELINMLSVIDNPCQDYALAGYMLSYLGGYTEDELNKIVMTAKKQVKDEGLKNLDLYGKVTMYPTFDKTCIDEALADKIKCTLDRLEYYRVVGSYMSVRGLVEKIVSDTRYDAYLNSKSEALGNSFGLYVQSISEDSITLSKYLREYKESGRELKGKAEGGDRVQVSTMHAYKGLEKPVIFLPCSQATSKATKDETIKFRKKGDNVSLPDLSIDPSGVIGMSYFDIDGRTKEDYTISNKVTQILASEKEYREEMRLLYVALTRAQKKMYITGTYKDSKNPLSIPNFTKKHGCEIFEKQESLFDYIATAINRGCLSSSIVKTLHRDGLEEVEEEGREPFYMRIGEKTEFEKQLTEEIKKAQSFVYPHQEETELSIKYTVTQINREGIEELSATFPIYEEDSFEEASLSQEELSNNVQDRNEVSIATIGTIYHKVMEHIDFSIDNLDNTTNAIDKMVDDGILTKEERGHIKDNEILSALKNDIIKQAVGAMCHHELPFVMYVPAKSVLEGSKSEDKVLVQGVIDLLVEGKEKYIVDFKYSSLNTKISRKKYEKQLKLYKMAYKVAFGEEIDKIVLLSLKTGESFEL